MNLSQTFEYAYTEWCLSRLVEGLARIHGGHEKAVAELQPFFDKVVLGPSAWGLPPGAGTERMKSSGQRLGPPSVPHGS